MCRSCRDKDLAVVNGKEYSADLAGYSEGMNKLNRRFNHRNMHLRNQKTSMTDKDDEIACGDFSPCAIHEHTV